MIVLVYCSGYEHEFKFVERFETEELLNKYLKDAGVGADEDYIMFCGEVIREIDLENKTP